jgi:hypothetical protein
VFTFPGDAFDLAPESRGSATPPALANHRIGAMAPCIPDTVRIHATIRVVA